MNKHRIRQLNAWVVCLVASLFFFYEFIQMNLFNAISASLMQSFAINATGLSRLSAFYFVANVVFLFPAGALLDRFSSRWVILTALFVCIVGTGLFATAHSYSAATFYRFLTGIGSAFCFLSVIRLATRWFHPRQLAFVIGMVVTVAMLGGVVAQKPLSLLVEALGWRKAIFVDAFIGLSFWLAIFVFVRDHPPEYQHQHQLQLKHIQALGYWKSLGLAFLSVQNWLCGIFTCLMNLPVIILGGLWGVLYLEHAHGLAMGDAPQITQMLFFGTIVGSPLCGWISDKIGRRRLPMLVGALLSFMVMTILVSGVALSFWSLIFLFLLLGFLTSVQVISYSVVAESSLPAITAMSVSVINICAQGGLALFEPLFGWLMDVHHRVKQIVGTVYVAHDFSWAMWMFVAGIVMAFLAALAMKETYARSASCAEKTVRGA